MRQYAIPPRFKRLKLLVLLAKMNISYSDIIIIIMTLDQDVPMLVISMWWRLITI